MITVLFLIVEFISGENATKFLPVLVCKCDVRFCEHTRVVFMDVQLLEYLWRSCESASYGCWSLTKCEEEE